MNLEVKRRIVMSLVSLALAFGLLATYYIVTVPWNRTAVGQALTAGAVLGIAALVMQFMPIRAPVPVASAEQKPEQVEKLEARRSWQPEPDFGAEDFQHDLAAAPLAASDPAPDLGVGVPSALPVATTTPILAATIEAPRPVHEPPAPDSPARPPIIPQRPAASAAVQDPSGVVPEVLERAIEAADKEADSGVLSLDEIKEAEEVLIGRNDDVRVRAEEGPIATVPTISVQSYRAEPVRAASIPVAKATPSVSPAVRVARPTPTRQSPKTEWREPDPETPKELLRELAEYWHVKYETERKRHNDMLAQYEDIVRRLENLETAEALGTANGSVPRRVIQGEPPFDEMSVADAMAHEGKNDREDRWDRRAAQMERFH